MGHAAAVADSELVYLARGPGQLVHVRAVVANGDGTAAAPGAPVHVCDQIPQVGKCVDAEVEPAGAVLRTDDRFTFEVPWEERGTTRTEGFDWLAVAVYTLVEGERCGQWFDDVPDRSHRVPTASEPGPHTGGPISMPGGHPPPDTAASFPALES